MTFSGIDEKYGMHGMYLVRNVCTICSMEYKTDGMRSNEIARLSWSTKKCSMSHTGMGYVERVTCKRRAPRMEE